MSKVQLTIRMSEQMEEYTKSKAAEIGSSQSSFINVLLDLGKKVYEGVILVQEKQ